MKLKISHRHHLPNPCCLSSAEPHGYIHAYHSRADAASK